MKTLRIVSAFIFMVLFVGNLSAQSPSTNIITTDYAAINNLIVAERMYRVSHRNEELAKCYVEDAQIHTSWQNGGVNTFVGQTTTEMVEELPMVNRCGGALIHQNGNKAFVEYPTTTIRGVYVNGVEAVLTSYMRLLYRVEKRNGEWKITSMESINESDELVPAIPGQDLKINPEDVKDIRLSYRWLTYTRRIAGGTISQDLPGTDRPDSAEKLYREADEWLNKSVTGSIIYTPAEKEEIIRTLETYLEGNRKADRKILSKVFAETATVSTNMNGTFSNRSIQSFYTILEGAGPSSGSYTLTVCNVEKDIAMVRIELELGEHKYTDMLTLVKDRNKWKIVNKTSHRHY